MVLRQGTVPILAGLVARTMGAFVIGSVVASLLFGVCPHDPAVIGAVVAIVVSTGISACLVAVLRGLRLYPASAVREE